MAIPDKVRTRRVGHDVDKAIKGLPEDEKALYTIIDEEFNKLRETEEHEIIHFGTERNKIASEAYISLTEELSHVSNTDKTSDYKVDFHRAFLKTFFNHLHGDNGLYNLPGRIHSLLSSAEGESLEEKIENIAKEDVNKLKQLSFAIAEEHDKRTYAQLDKGEGLQTFLLMVENGEKAGLVYQKFNKELTRAANTLTEVSIQKMRDYFAGHYGVENLAGYLVNKVNSDERIPITVEEDRIKDIARVFQEKPEHFYEAVQALMQKQYGSLAKYLGTTVSDEKK